MATETLNILSGWIGICLGVFTGALFGLLFHKEDWLGGYNSWPRRMLRLGHISFFGIAFLNFMFSITTGLEALHGTLIGIGSILFLVGGSYHANRLLPVCLEKAIKESFPHSSGFHLRSAGL